MSPLLESRLVLHLRTLVRASHPDDFGTHMTDQQVYAFEDEKDFLLDQFEQLETREAWWSNEEWEWFINRCLDFLGAN